MTKFTLELPLWWGCIWVSVVCSNSCKSKVQNWLQNLKPYVQMHYKIDTIGKIRSTTMTTGIQE